MKTLLNGRVPLEGKRVTANYDNLTTAQQVRFDALMTQPMNQWPPELITHVRNQRPFCGDALADAVAGWVRSDGEATP